MLDPKRTAALRKLAKSSGMTEQEWMHRTIDAAASAQSATPRDVADILKSAGIRFTIVCEGDPAEAWALIAGAIKSRPDEPVPIDLVRVLKGE